MLAQHLEDMFRREYHAMLRSPKPEKTSQLHHVLQKVLRCEGESLRGLVNRLGGDPDKEQVYEDYVVTSLLVKVGLTAAITESLQLE